MTTAAAPLHYDGFDRLAETGPFVAYVDHWFATIDPGPLFSVFDDSAREAPESKELIAADLRLGTALASSPMTTAQVIEVWEAHHPLPCQACGALQPASRDECYRCGHDLKVYRLPCDECNGEGQIEQLNTARLRPNTVDEPWETVTCVVCNGKREIELEWAADRATEAILGPGVTAAALVRRRELIAGAGRASCEVEYVD